MTSDVEPATRYADVCFLTDLRFPGGNASSTLDEVATLRAAGLRVLLMHCPSWMHRGKPVSTRYDGLAELCLTDPAGTERVVADTVLVRHPLVVCADDFPAVAGRITARKAAFIVNNAMRRAGGDEAYDLRRYLERFEAFDATHRLIFPIGPLVREELAAALPSRLLGQLAPFDWTPTFDLSQLRFQPRASLRPPYRIGRHGRDSAEKWLQQPEQLTQAYPTSTDYSVRILGGDDGALAVLGERPRNWCVHPFGSLPTPRYLADLDVFVYFPHTELREAFGRAIVEAMVAGVPCVLPAQLREAFADLAFFCEPAQVDGVVRRLAEHDALRLAFLRHAHQACARAFASNALLTRLERLDAAAELGVCPHVDDDARPPAALQRYRAWVETGEGSPK